MKNVKSGFSYDPGFPRDQTSINTTLYLTRDIPLGFFSHVKIH